MQIQNIIEKREKLHQFINSIEEKRIEAMYIMFENEIEFTDIEAYNKDIEEAEKEIEEGNFYTHEQVLEEVKSWIK